MSKSSGKVNLWVEWGYEIHSLKISAPDWAGITEGEKISLNGKNYFYDGDEFECTWNFNHDKYGSLTVIYAKVDDDGFNIGDGYCGRWQDAHPTT